MELTARKHVIFDRTFRIPSQKDASLLICNFKYQRIIVTRRFSGYILW